MKKFYRHRTTTSFARPAACAFVVMTCLGAVRADWPQYLGPNRNATSTETDILRAWPEEGPQVLWTVPVGKGFAGPAISGGKVYLLDRIGDQKDALRCFDLLLGKELWKFEYEAPGATSFPGSRTVPAIDGDYVYTCGPFGDVFCLNVNTHQPVWEKNIWTDYDGGKIPMWGITQSPLIYGDFLILAAQTDKAGIVAFDKQTGEQRWATPALPGRLGYVTPTLIQIDGEDHLVMISTGPDPRKSEPQPLGAVIGLDPRTGRELWRYQGWQCRLPVPNITAIGDGRIFIAAGYLAGSAMIRVERKAGAYNVTELFKNPDFNTHVHPAVYYQGHLFAHGTTNENRDGMMCMDLEGNIKWKTGRSPTFDKGGFILVDGLILSVNGTRDSNLYVIQPSPEGFKPLASAKLLESPQSWAPLALSDGKLIIRDQDHLKCVAVR